MATALATAGLLAGIFGSTLAPVAQAATFKAGLVQSEIRGNVEGDIQDVVYGYDSQTYNDGSAALPYVIYSPIYNDGEGNVDEALCTYVNSSEIEAIDGNDLIDSEDVAATVTTSGGLLVAGADQTGSYDGDWSGTAADWGTSYSDENVNDGVSFCVTANDDDTAVKNSVVTVKINGQKAADFNVTIVGPGKKITAADRTGGWVAMNNNSIAKALQFTFTDAAGTSMFFPLADADTLAVDSDYSGGGDVNLIEQYWDVGYDSWWYYLEFYRDAVGPGDENDSGGAVDYNGQFRRADFDSNFCNGDEDAIASTHTVLAVMDRDDASEGYLSAKDFKANPITVSCSAAGDEAVVTGIDFGSVTQIELGGATPLNVHIQDGYGNPMGIGSDETIDPGFSEGYLYSPYVWDNSTAFFPSPLHVDNSVPYDTDYERWMVNQGANFEYEATTDANTTCDGTWYSGFEDGNVPEYNDNLADYLVAGPDNSGAGNVIVCYYASTMMEDLGTNYVSLPLAYPYPSALAGIIGTSPVTFKASINLVRDTGATSAFGAALKVGKKTVSITGPIGAKVTFVVEDSAGNVKTYLRTVDAVDKKAKFVFKKAGTFDVYAMFGDSLTPLARIKVLAKYL